MQTFLVAYDITDPARLRHVAQLLEDFGRRLQQSVFLCVLGPNDADELVR